jgi:hypothetical protein
VIDLDGKTLAEISLAHLAPSGSGTTYWQIVDGRAAKLKQESGLNARAQPYVKTWERYGAASVVSTSWYDRLKVQINFVEKDGLLADIEVGGYDGKPVSLRKITDLKPIEEKTLTRSRWSRPTRRVATLSEKLVEAFGNKGRDSIKSLLLEGADPNGIFLRAIRENDEDTALLLLDAGADPKVRGGTHKRPESALGLAAHHGHAKLVQALIAQHVPLNDRADWGWTPLMRAAMTGHLDALNLLLSAGADKSLKDEDGLTALDHARKKGQKKVTEALERH